MRGNIYFKYTNDLKPYLTKFGFNGKLIEDIRSMMLIVSFEFNSSILFVDVLWFNDHKKSIIMEMDQIFLFNSIQFIKQFCIIVISVYQMKIIDNPWHHHDY